MLDDEFEEWALLLTGGVLKALPVFAGLGLFVTGVWQRGDGVDGVTEELVVVVDVVVPVSEAVATPTPEAD